MAPLLIAQDPDLTDSEEEKKEISKSTESVQEENKQLIIPVPSSAEKYIEIFLSESSDASQLKVASENIQQSVQQTAVNEQPAPWDGPPAEEPVYPPGTYRGIF